MPALRWTALVTSSLAALSVPPALAESHGKGVPTGSSHGGQGKSSVSSPKRGLPSPKSKPGSKADPETIGYRLRQHMDWRGAMILDLSKYGVRYSSKDLGALLTPDEKIYVLNDSTKKYCIMDRTRWKQQHGMWSNDPGPERQTFAAKEKMLGLEVTHYKLEKLKYRMVMTQPNKPVKQLYPDMLTEVWATKDLQIPEPLLRSCADACLVPYTYGYPLKVIRRYAFDPSKKVWLRQKPFIETKSITRMPFKKSHFVLPPYGKVADEVEVMMGETDLEKELKSF